MWQDNYQEYHEWTSINITIRKKSKVEKVKIHTEKVNTVLQHIPTENINYLNEFIYAEGKLVSDNKSISLG